MTAPAKDLTPLVRPRSIALVGATPLESNKLGSWTLGNLLKHDVPADLYLVNPRYDTLEGRPCYPDLGSLPGGPRIGARVGARRLRPSTFCAKPRRSAAGPSSCSAAGLARATGPDRRWTWNCRPFWPTPRWRFADPTPTGSSTAWTASRPGFPRTPWPMNCRPEPSAWCPRAVPWCPRWSNTSWTTASD